MSQAPSQKFGAEYVAHLRELLDIAAEEIGPEHRAPATKAKITRTRIGKKDRRPEARHFTNAASTAGEDRTA